MNWPLPPAEVQNSNLADSDGCVSFSAVHIIESQEIQQYGSTIGYSERALAKLSGTTKNGNTVENVLNAINQYGLIPDSLWPTELGTQWTWDEFYKDIPSEILAQAVPVSVKLIGGANYNLSPVWTQILLDGKFGHMVEGLNQTQFFDSYQAYLKTYDSHDQIVWQGNLVLNPERKRMLVFFQIKGSQTVWSLMDGMWVGFADLTAFNNYVSGRAYTIVELDQTEFNKVQSSPDIFKN